MVDLHCHILPGLDDGPATLDDALELARATLAAGVTMVCATTHVSPTFPTQAAAIHEGVAQLRDALEQRGMPLTLRPGAEVALEMLAERDDDELAALRLGRGRFLLLEAPLTSRAGDAEPSVITAQERGFRVVLAHPERSPQFQQNPENLRRLAARGVLMSVTASSFSGRFGEPAAKLAELLLREGLVHDICSDMHDLAGRPPGIAGPIAESGDLGRLIAPHLGWFAEAMPRAILTGTRFPGAPLTEAFAESRVGRMRRRFRPGG
ncbi:tyrosine-protein phosphatase [Baekduia alba]|uniref:tyrosine-protein phosphatase n=1 Tax=Baekduia alba TaxID=2997333 RepID=UPI0023424D54|nr:CpsB/CapC family capsule biosynthesis tyrosine phosphatase [Baekduia alba]